LNTATSKIVPKQRFQFKNRSSAFAVDPEKDPRHLVGNPSPGGQHPTSQEQRDVVGALPRFNKNYNEELSRPGGPGVRKPSFSAARDISISEHAGLHIILPSTAARATSSGSLTDLKGCIIDMSVPTTGVGAPFASLALKDIDKSLIVAGKVTGAAHITGVKNSIIVVTARQVRIHECKNVDIYLYCASHPIIEDCSGMRFAPIPATYVSPPYADNLLQPILTRGVYDTQTTEEDDPTKNQWDQVDDFKWLKTEHSPNWSILPEDERVAEELWKGCVPGGPGVGVDDIFKKLGVGAR
jgi:hypothetical protein